MRLDLYKKTFVHQRSGWIRFLWFLVSSALFEGNLLPSSSLKILILRLFGANLGKGIVVKPSVKIKFPWNLSVGDYVWIGESVWIDNLYAVTIASNVCISQGAVLLTGNHDYTKETFDLTGGPIVLEDSTWIGARAIICPGVSVPDHCVVTVGSVVSSSPPRNTVVRGNPGVPIRTTCPGDAR